MGWSRIDDGYMDHPKIMEAGPWAELLDRRAMEHCAKYETDGLVTRTALRRIGRDIPKVHDKVLRLIDVGRWRMNEAGGWWIHDYLLYNPSKAERQAQRDAGKERQQRWRNARSNAVTNDVVTKGRGGESFANAEIARCERCGTPKTDPPTDCCAEVLELKRTAED